MIGFDVVKWALKHCIDRERLLEAFLGPNRLLRALPREGGWHGREVALPNGDRATRGRAYAIRRFDGEALVAQGSAGPEKFCKWLEGLVYEQSAALGKAMECALRGDAREMSFEEISQAAGLSGLAAGTAGVRPIDDSLGFKFLHLGEVPHIVDDDNYTLRTMSFDGIEIRMRVFGNPVPLGTRLPE